AECASRGVVAAPARGCESGAVPPAAGLPLLAGAGPLPPRRRPGRHAPAARGGDHHAPAALAAAAPHGLSEAHRERDPPAPRARLAGGLAGGFGESRAGCARVEGWVRASRGAAPGCRPAGQKVILVPSR